MKIKINIQRATGTPEIPTDRKIRNWAKSALYNREKDTELTIRIVDTDESTQLNQRWRNISSPTNVLSFSMKGAEQYTAGLIGDIVICAPVVNNEAVDQNKPVEAHWAHMVIHGVLHLLGYDHNNSKEAKKMESMETTLLESLGYKNPYF
jgi:probable rRNA maturation factor